MKISKQLTTAITFMIIMLIPTLANGQGGPIGWASVNANGQNGTTGGVGGEVVTVTNMAQLVSAASQTNPLIIQVEGMITQTDKGRYVEVRSDKTIIGIGPGAGISQGGFRVGSNQKNIIFKNLTIADTYVDGDWDGKEQDYDGIQIKGTCHHIWIDHCTFLRQGDGAVDITNGANYVTVSNSVFGANNKTGLIGSSDTDTFRDRYKVTMHHNWFNETTQRNPRVRFGMVHLFNNYYYNMGGYGRAMGFANSNGYGIGVGVGAQIYSEHNYFDRVVKPTEFIVTQALPGFIIDIGSHFIASGNMRTAPDGINWDPADYYEYTLDEAVDVKNFVMANAGAEQPNTGTLPQLLAQSGLNLANYPNPFSDQTVLTFTMAEAGEVNFNIKDITGRNVRMFTKEFKLPGDQQIIIRKENLKSGMYFLQVETNKFSDTRKILIN